MYYVYILKSKVKPITYTGYTTNIERRLKAHNSGSVKATKSYRPYELLQLEKFLSDKEAKIQELYYKSTSGRRKIKKRLRLAKKI
ncbi:MAG: GIY-YIG nuclease family protein [Candidatus Omnitrophica bacterium]|nr:GIY-YIG nuclease family protein [Candidatus Omnitrophota bacterium]MBU1926110.1 GIY-YIG nuclease family protein [Candidatus Omnitrophota bacterium]